MDELIVSSVNFIPDIIKFEDDENQLLTNFFEKLIETDRIDNVRNCRCVNTSQEKINKVKPGEYINLEVSSGGFFTQWYYFYSIIKVQVLIFQTANKYDNFTYYYRIINNRPLETTY